MHKYDEHAGTSSSSSFALIFQVSTSVFVVSILRILF